MRVISLLVEDFKKIRCVRWRPGPHGNEIVGLNAQGKSSCLDAIWSAIGGAKASPKVPIRDGAGSAKATINLGDLKITRTWTSTGNYLQVEDAAGSVQRAPQSLLDSLGASLSMNPLAFSTQDEKTQIKTLLETFKVEVGDLEAMSDDVSEQRRQKNLELKRCRAAADSIEVDPRDTVMALDEGAVRQELESARERVRELERQLDQAMKQRGAIERAKQKEELEDEASFLEYESQQLTLQLQEIAKARKIRLARIGEMVPGLTVDDDRLLYDGLPISQASMSRKVLLGMTVAVAANPELKVVLLRDGSLLDDQTLEDVHAFAEQRDVQVLIEKVGNSLGSHHGIVITEGEISDRCEPDAAPGDRVLGGQTWSEVRQEPEGVF